MREGRREGREGLPYITHPSLLTQVLLVKVVEEENDEERSGMRRLGSEGGKEKVENEKGSRLKGRE